MAPPVAPTVPKVLVIKLGALGDFVQTLAAMARIRAAHLGAEITLLTTAPFADLGAASPYIDRVEADGRPGTAGATLAMLQRVRGARYDRVYDLQTSSRTDAYFQALRLLAPLRGAPVWSGVAPGCALPHRNPGRDRMHTLERQADQLREAGIWPDAPTAPGAAPPPDLGWLIDPGAAERFGLRRPYALLVPGGSAHRPAKRWPAERYGELARALGARGLEPVVIGGPGERDLAAAIPTARDLTGRTGFGEVASLGAGAELAVGNDTGPLHLIAGAGAPTLALFSAASDPALSAPRGRAVRVLRRERLAALAIAEVLGALAAPPFAP